MGATNRDNSGIIGDGDNRGRTTKNARRSSPHPMPPHSIRSAKDLLQAPALQHAITPLLKLGLAGLTEALLSP